jgi:hypothetical protein
MGTTNNYKFPIYDDDWAPDLTTTGAEAQAITAIDTVLKKQEKQESDDASRLNQLIQAERTERTDADTALQSNIDKETQSRKDADSKLRTSVETVENEVTSVSADVTGIMGLTYGDDHLNFIEHSGDTYSSPALVEIQHQITDASAVPAWGTVTDKPFETLGDGLSVADGVLSASGGSSVNSIAPLTVTTAPTVTDSTSVAIGDATNVYGTGCVAINGSVGTAATPRADCVAINGHASGIGIVVINSKYSTHADGDVVIGYGAKIRASSADTGPDVLIGYNARTIAGTSGARGSVVLGANSVATSPNSVSVGSDTFQRVIDWVATPTIKYQAANKAYVDSAVASASGITKDTVWSDIES